MLIFRSYPFVLLALLLCSQGISEPFRATVKSDQAVLRAAPNTESEAVLQVSKGTVLNGIEQKGDWLCVSVPPSADLWVYGPLVRDGQVAATKVQVRCGPGLKYAVVGTLNHGDRVDERGAFNDWLKVAPPEGSRLWIGSQHTGNQRTPAMPPVVRPAETVRPAGQVPAPATDRVAATPPAVTPPIVRIPAIGVEQSARVIPHRDELSLPPIGSVEPSHRDAPQVDEAASPSASGESDAEVYRGKLRRSSIVWRRYSRYCLVARNGAGRYITVCGIDNGERQIDGFLGKTVRIAGQPLDRQGTKWPIIRVSDIAAE